MSDVYSLGCFFFYMLSGGSYPFDVNIINTPCTKKLSKAYIEFIKVETDEKILALNLIEKMLNDDPNQRPTAAKIEHHPTFWDSKKKMDFLTDVYMKNENDPNVPKFVAALETKKSQVIGGNWMTPLADALKEDLTNRTYQFDSLDSLLRYIRNKKTHFVDEKKQEVRDAFGTSQDEVIVYFTRLFPKLIMHVLNVVAQNIGMFETVFKDKYLKFYN